VKGTKHEEGERREESLRETGPGQAGKNNRDCGGVITRLRLKY